MENEIKCIGFGKDVSEILAEISDGKFESEDFCRLFEKDDIKTIEYISKGRYFELGMENKLLLDSDRNFIENLKFNEELDSRKGKNFGWKVTLVNPSTRLISHNTISCSTKKCIENKRYPVKVAKNKDINIGNAIIHKGHLLAYDFFDCIPHVPVQFTKEKKGTKNKYNIYTQFKRANCNKKNDHGQLYFENKVSNYLKKSDTAKIYYEVEAIFRNENDVVPMGNRIKAISLDKTTDFKDFHVFIPNFQEIGFKDSINKDTGYKFSYAKGFEKK
ncbi:MAG: hypothetical protein HDT50_07745 [Lactobacillus sp.]|nr:hypothetical protein [Lactobacillus sp.]